MSERTFLYIHKIIRFDDVLTRRGQRNDDKFAPIRNLWEKWSEQLPIFYNPNDCVNVDEQLLGFHGRCKFRQYIPSKPKRYGLKFWLLVDSRTCYVWKIQPYLGKGVTGNTERNQGERVVLDLVDGLKGHNVTMDNFFSSHSLGQKLLQKQMSMVGTMRKNKRSIPPKLLNCKKVPRYESTFAFTPDTTLVSYISHKNKCTVVMSTLHHAPNIENESKKLPEIISFYNSTKGGVDTVDKMLSCYSCKRKNNRWTMAVFSNIIDISALNSYILYNDIDPNWKQTQKHTKRKCFLHELAISLAKPYMEKRKKAQGTNYLWHCFPNCHPRIFLTLVIMMLAHQKNTRMKSLRKKTAQGVKNAIILENIKISGHRHSASYVKSRAATTDMPKIFA
ncbi:piggyBac transposable element-derived protein 4-like [Bactrocera dorsalis]|uniref:PiggyBac transposable element-derived protein 4-like n=1 Tax=Bactrocera dorsalis TaxID=27457 RepID=A0ABM3IY03_BACDO|nr:piggyBac transposable element-derived protein 4-like [Bactrocera dorsalis]XP_049301867.1 piggyBac transposable element-derived protein 4-like [Bactrocera dorsalis]XP_049301868.1 piggyBac transposable element-derived protein 4-like [Bactrocera dorsalis]